MLRALILSVALAAGLASPAEAADAHWLCYAGKQATRGPATLCWPAGTGDEAAPGDAPLAGWQGARKRETPRTVEVLNRLGRTSVRVKGGTRLFLTPIAGGQAWLTCRAARAPKAREQRVRLVLTDAHGQHVLTVAPAAAALRVGRRGAPAAALLRRRSPGRGTGSRPRRHDGPRHVAGTARHAPGAVRAVPARHVVSVAVPASR